MLLGVYMAYILCTSFFNHNQVGYDEALHHKKRRIKMSAEDWIMYIWSTIEENCQKKDNDTHKWKWDKKPSNTVGTKIGIVRREVFSQKSASSPHFKPRTNEVFGGVCIILLGG